ncbi:MAG: hypothetical protein Q8R11_02620 [bacterium]|nr:hypothetical protein [bacterium]
MKGNNKLLIFVLVILLVIASWQLIRSFSNSRNKLDMNTTTSLPKELGTRKTTLSPISETTTSSARFITQEEAVEKVSQLPEVKEKTAEWFRLGATKVGFMAFEDMDENGEWTSWRVQFYEDKPTHITTIDWYRVDAVTGEVKKEST